MTIRLATKEEVLKAIEESVDPKADAFAKTFVGKADKQDMWGKCKGVFDADGNLNAICITTVSKREPKSANLQLMHTFAKYRGLGIGKLLVEDSLDIAREQGCKYFRVSAERTAVGFYAKCGIPFIGMQKSGTFLALFNLEGPRDRITQYIKDKALKKPGKILKERCENPNEKEKETIQMLGSNYLYNNVVTWFPSVSG